MSRDARADVAGTLGGAVDYAECPVGGGGRCPCGKCMTCGFKKHMAIHGPLLGQPPGSKPYGHAFVPEVIR